ncbi:hypothetical protein QFC19_006185 [Naganishia cerealis]|uniref:Uncharacterized protein n=1 Tax=Naganishia cerealis TaxID=610337 RepID=A0ACC2VIM5_9TREE|nr:hypothetical protein QFC19_006185 [Naganishia cerealis]
MDPIRARLDVISPETSQDTATTLTNPRAILDEAFARRLLGEKSGPTYNRNGNATTSTQDSTIALAKNFALCIEFERTVEDESLWQSSFANLGQLDGDAGGDSAQSKKTGHQGKDVLLIWPDIESHDDLESASDHEPRLSIYESVLEHHPSLAELLDVDATADGIAVQVSLVRPPVLTKVILHRIPSDGESSCETFLDHAEEAKDVLEELAGKRSDSAQSDSNVAVPVIMHQNTHWTSAKGNTYIVLLALPFTQGVISSSSTEVIISSTPSTAPISRQNGISSELSGSNPMIDRLAFSATLQHRHAALGGMARSATTRSTRQQRAMMNFSADGFLSASLVVDPARERKEAGRKKRAEMRGLMSSVGIDELEEEEDEADDPFWDDELDDDHPASNDGEDTDVVLGLGARSSLSESSGSITPRPRSFVDSPEYHHLSAITPDMQVQDESYEKPLMNGIIDTGIAHPGGSVGRDSMNGLGETEEQAAFRGFAFEPFPLRRRPLSASTRFYDSAVKFTDKGKGKMRGRRRD